MTLPLYFLDTETTGLSPQRHEIIELCIHRRHDGVGKTWIWKVRPDHIETANPRALQINGYDPATWEKEGITQSDLAAMVLQILRDPGIVVAHNAKFDLGFLGELMDLHHPQYTLPANVICTARMARQLSHVTGWEKASMAYIRDRIGLSSHGAHTAEKDVMDLVIIYDHLAQQDGNP